MTTFGHQNTFRRLAGTLAMSVAFLFAGALMQGNLAQGAEKAAAKYRAYFGTYTKNESKGIYVAEFDTKTGMLSEARLVAEVENPSFLAIHGNGKLLYATSEIGNYENKDSGAVYAYAINAETGGLTLLNAQATGGAGPCHLIVDPSGKNVLVANYHGGSVACLPLKEDGSLKSSSTFIQHSGSSVNPQRQEGPHAHSINVDITNKYAFAADLGLDKVLVYQFDASQGTLKPHSPAYASVPAGGGPRHFSFHPDYKFAYTNNEMTSSVTAFQWNATRGVLTPIQTISTLPGGKPVPGNSTAEIRVHPNGRFLYVSNRGHNSIAVFGIDTSTGLLTAIEQPSSGGMVPRNFNFDPTGKYLLAANHNSNNVVVFELNAKTGKLQSKVQELTVPFSVCVRFVAY